MAVAKMYGNFIAKALNKEIDWDSDEIKVALFTEIFTPNQDTQEYFDDLSGEVPNGDGYTTGGVTLTNKSITYNPADNTVTIDADDVVWTDASISARYAVIYDNTPTTNKPLIAYIDFENTMSSTNANFSLVFAADGIAKFTTP